MTETTARYEYQKDREDGLNWARIAGISAAIAVHVAALMLLMAPVSPPQTPPSPPTQPPARPSPPSGDLSASMCTRPNPQYPREAMRAGITGTVKVLVQFNNSGAITNASVSRGSGNRDLDRAATTAVKRARLCPGSGDGSGYIDVNFTL